MLRQSLDPPKKTIGPAVGVGELPGGVDPLAKTVKIPVRVVNGRAEMLYGGPLPVIQDGTIGELILPSYSVTDPDLLKWLQEERTVELLPEGAKVFLGLNLNNIPQHLLSKTHRPETQHPPMKYGGGFPLALVEVILMDSLRLRLRGSKKAILEPCKCKVSILDDPDADSLNHAISLISQRLEPKRRSHSLNVFGRAFFLIDDRWVLLDDLRTSFEARVESCLIFASKLNAILVSALEDHKKQQGNSIRLPYGDKEILVKFFEGKASDLSEVLGNYFSSHRDEVIEVFKDHQLMTVERAYSNGSATNSSLGNSLFKIAMFCKSQGSLSNDDFVSAIADLILEERRYLLKEFTLMVREDIALLGVVNAVLETILAGISTLKRDNH